MASNPSIFEKAIAGSADYDEAIKALAGSTQTDEQMLADPEVIRGNQWPHNMALSNRYRFATESFPEANSKWPTTLLYC